MSKASDKRLWFIREVVFVRKLTDNPRLANEWYVSNKAKGLTTDDAIAKFQTWITRD